ATMGSIIGLFIHQTGRYVEPIYVGLILLTIVEGLPILLDSQTRLGKILGFEVLTGSGIGMLFQAPLIAVQAMVRQDEVATATGTLGFVRNIATSLGVVVGGVIFSSGMDKRRKDLINAGLPSALIENFSGHNASANVVLVGAIQDAAQRLAVKEAYAGSLKFVWVFYTCTGACGLISSVFIARMALSTEHV